MSKSRGISFSGLFTLILAFNSAYSFDSKIDSLEARLLTSKSIPDQIKTLQYLFDEYEMIDYDKALKIALQHYSLTTRFETKPSDKMESLNRVGIAYMNLNQLDSAMLFFQELGDLAYAYGDSVFLSKSYNNIGVLSAGKGNVTSTVYYFNKSAEIDEELGDVQGAIASYANIGTVYLTLGSIDSARYYLKKSLKAADRVGDEKMIGSCYLNLGALEIEVRNFSDAKTYLFKALECGENSRDYDLIAKTNRNMARVFQLQGMYKIAIEYDLRSLQIADSVKDLSNAIEAHLGLAVSYESVGMYKEALENFKEHTMLLDSLIELENSKAFVETVERLKSAQTMKENKILNQQNDIKNLEIAKNEEEIENSQIVIFSSIAGLILLLVLAATLYNRNIIKQRANVKLQEANEIIQEKNSDILASIEYASKIQEALLPTRENPELFGDSFFLLRPKDIVSGDFLWYSDLGSKKVLAAVDCTGHGVPGAFMSMIGNTFLHQIINERGISDPAEILNELRRNVIRALNQKGQGVNRKDGMDMGLCVIDQEQMILEFAGANNPLFVIQKNGAQEIKGDKQPVGYFEGIENPFNRQRISIEKGDCIYLYSDGYADQFGGPKGKKFKYKQLKELLQHNHLKPMLAQKEILNRTFDEWKGNLEQVDDVCVLGVRIA